MKAKDILFEDDELLELMNQSNGRDPFEELYEDLLAEGMTPEEAVESMNKFFSDENGIIRRAENFIKEIDNILNDKN